MPEYGEEELIRQRSDRLEERSEGVLPERVTVPEMGVAERMSAAEGWT